MVSYAGTALVTGVLEEGGVGWSKWRRDGGARKQLDERNLCRMISRGG